MEHKTFWKNFLLFTISGLAVLHMNMLNAAEVTNESVVDLDSSDECVLLSEG